MNVLPLLIDAYNLTTTEDVSVDNTTLEILTAKTTKTTRRPRKRKTTRSPTAEDEGLPLGFIIAVGVALILIFAVIIYLFVRKRQLSQRSAKASVREGSSTKAMRTGSSSAQAEQQEEA
ncbi:hypothetical protein V3C99_016687 [Haemonchus contortus]